MKKKYHGGSEQEIDYCRKPKQKNSENSPRTYKKFRHKHDMQIYKGIEFLKPQDRNSQKRQRKILHNNKGIDTRRGYNNF